MPIHRRRGQLYVPADMLQAVGVTREAFLGNDDKSAHERVISVMTALAREHLAILRQPERTAQKPRSGILTVGACSSLSHGDRTTG